jgi:secondary thiamine-phosphate synthase enzyme
MPVTTHTLQFSTRGEGDTRDITREVAAALAGSGLRDGIVSLFVVGSTAGLTTIEFEPGAVSDFAAAFERLAPRAMEYEHHLRWHDDNGHSHVRAALLGPALVVPFSSGILTLGTWQQIILVDFDTRPRRRDVVAQLIGE